MRRTVRTSVQVLAKVMGTDACMARIGIASADHALACALFGQLRPGDHALFVSQALGQDTHALLSGPFGSLEDWGVKCTVLDPFESHIITEDGALDTGRIAACIQTHNPNVVVLRRFQPPVLLTNDGIESEPSSISTTLCRGHFFTCSAIQIFADAIRSACIPVSTPHDEAMPAHAQSRDENRSAGSSDVETHSTSDQVPIVVVDNRGGEFIEQMEPGAAGVDLVTGSLLGSLGGSVAPSGGYVAGRQELVERACARFSAPGVVSRCCKRYTCCPVGILDVAPGKTRQLRL